MPSFFDQINRTITRTGPQAPRRTGSRGSGFFGSFQSQNSPYRSTNTGSFFGDLIAQNQNQEFDRQVAEDSRELGNARARAEQGGMNLHGLQKLNQAYAFDEEESGRNDLRRVLNEYYVPTLEEDRGFLQDYRNQFTEQFFGDPDLSGAMEAIQRMGQGAIGELSQVGGAIDQATRTAASGAAESGFGTVSGTFDRQRANILNRAQGQVGSQISQAAPEVYLGLLQNQAQMGASGASLLGSLMSNRNDLMDSLFSGRTNIEALRMAQRQLAESTLLNRQNLELEREAQSGGGIGGFLGGALGTAAGSFLGPLGSAAGAKLGGQLFGGGGGIPSRPDTSFMSNIRGP